MGQVIGFFKIEFAVICSDWLVDFLAEIVGSGIKRLQINNKLETLLCFDALFKEFGYLNVVDQNASASSHTKRTWQIAIITNMLLNVHL